MSHRLLILVALLVVVATLLFMQFPVSPTYAGRTIENAGHMPLFFLVTLGLLIVLRNDFKVEGVRLYVLAGLIGAGLGVLSEIIQQPLARDASWEDVLSDSVGAVCALAVYALFDRSSRISRAMRLIALLVALGCVAFYVTPLVRMTAAYVHRNGQFPVLADYRSPADAAWTIGYGTNRKLEGGALEVEFVDNPWPGMSLYEPVPDWSNYRTLLIDVENPEAGKLEITVKIQDRWRWQNYSDRFNRHFVLAAGERRTLRIDLAEVARAPKARLMDMSQISNIALFRSTPEGARRMRVYSLRLE